MAQEVVYNYKWSAMGFPSVDTSIMRTPGPYLRLHLRCRNHSSAHRNLGHGLASVVVVHRFGTMIVTHPLVD